MSERSRGTHAGRGRTGGDGDHGDDARYVGVDRASGEWVAVALGPDGDGERVTVHGEFEGVWAAHGGAELVLVDVPIGLPSADEPTRRCDALARKALGPRSSSVFPPPARAALGHDSHSAASEANRAATGKGLTVQAYHIADGVAAVEEFLRGDAGRAARGRVREAHPEVCFAAFAGGPPEHSKTTAAGYGERLSALAAAADDPATLSHRLADGLDSDAPAVDDLLDATALALTARPGDGALRTLPSDPPTDGAGLPMEMVYRAPTPLLG